MFTLNRNPRVYIQIDKDSLLLAALSKQGNRFVLKNNETIKLKNSEVQDDVICNTSGLFEKIVNFLNKHKLHGAYAIVCDSTLKDSDIKNKELKAFQTSLAICKTGLKIHKLIESNILKESTRCRISSLIKKIWNRS